MQDKELLKEFYLIASELDKNILRFKEVEDKMKKAQEENDQKSIQLLLNEYKIVSNNIKKLKERSEILKEEK